LTEEEKCEPEKQGVSATTEEEESLNDEKALAPAKDLEKEQETSRPPIDFESILPQTKWCKTCNCWKPDRTHHCSICDECVLKMDQ
jgi:7-cyano-7-deazaguanine synthase in queuosine biosynthesis